MFKFISKLLRGFNADNLETKAVNFMMGWD